MVKLVYCIRRKPGLSQAEFFRHWAEVHAPIGVRIPGLRKLVHSYAVAIAADSRPADFDGMAELWFDDVPALLEARRSPEWAASTADEANFVDLSHTAYFVSEERQMPKEVPLYDAHYGHLTADPQVAVRRRTYDEDLGQASWLTAAEAKAFFGLLGLGPGRTALELACGSGGVTCRMALETGATCVGVDLNPHGIEAARARAAEQGLSSSVSFERADASRRLPFRDQSFDAVFCNDSINHFPGRLEVLRDWHRVLRPGGRVLFTDPIVVTGQLTNEEIQARSSIGFFLYTPVGGNERLLAQSGFVVREVRDVTEAVASVSARWRAAREELRPALVALEGEESFAGVQRFLAAVHTLSSERRLSRFMYLAERA